MSGYLSVQKRQSFAAGFPIGARASLLTHDFPYESLVCYTFASVWRGKGVGGVLCNRPECSDKHFFTAVGQADFVTRVTAQTQIFEKQNLTVWRRKQRYKKFPSHRSAAYVLAFLPFPFAVGHGRFPALADGAF